MHQALERLAELQPRLVRLVELRFFVGLSVEETAEVMDLSRPTVVRDWKAARAWLAQRAASGGMIGAGATSARPAPWSAAQKRRIGELVLQIAGLDPPEREPILGRRHLWRPGGDRRACGARLEAADALRRGLSGHAGGRAARPAGGRASARRSRVRAGGRAAAARQPLFAGPPARPRRHGRGARGDRPPARPPGRPQAAARACAGARRTADRRSARPGPGAARPRSRGLRNRHSGRPSLHRHAPGGGPHPGRAG